MGVSAAGATRFSQRDRCQAPPDGLPTWGAARGPRNQADFRTELGSVIAKVASPAMARASCTAFRASWRSSLCFQVAHQAGNLIGIRGEKLLGGWVSANDAPGDVR